MLEADQTTYRQSFKERKPTITKCKPIILPEVKLIDPVSSVTIDIASLTPYQVNQSAHIPFDLFWTPKPIIGQTSNINLFKYDPPKKQRIKIKLSTVLSPSTPPEEASDETTYETIIKNIYLSTKSKAEKDVENLRQPRPNTNSYSYQITNPIKFNSEIYEKLPTKYIEMGKKWDNKNPRWLSDRNKFFWEKYFEKKQKKELSHEEERKLVFEKMKEITDLINTNEIRSPHITYKFGYGGYKPVSASGVSLKKNEFPIDHPLTTLSAASYRNKNIDL